MHTTLRYLQEIPINATCTQRTRASSLSLVRAVFCDLSDLTALAVSSSLLLLPPSLNVLTRI